MVFEAAATLGELSANALGANCAGPTMEKSRATVAPEAMVEFFTRLVLPVF